MLLHRYYYILYLQLHSLRKEKITRHHACTVYNYIATNQNIFFFDLRTKWIVNVFGFLWFSIDRVLEKPQRNYYIIDRYG